MGLKFIKFKAKFNAQAKEKTTEIVGLKYKVHSEFSDVNAFQLGSSSGSKTTTSKNNKTEVVKDRQPNANLRPTFEQIFQERPVVENGAAVSWPEKEKEVQELSVSEEVKEPEPIPPKSILKKNTIYKEDNEEPPKEMKIDDQISASMLYEIENDKEITVEENKLPLQISFYTTNDAQVEVNEGVQLEVEDDQEEYLINDEQVEVKNNKEEQIEIEKKLEEQLEVLGDEQVEVPADEQEEIIIKEQIIDINKEEIDLKTAEEIIKKQANVANQDESEISEYESEDESNEDEEYSSQAASIFFSGLEPSPRLRKKEFKKGNQEREELDDNDEKDVKTSA